MTQNNGNSYDEDGNLLLTANNVTESDTFSGGKRLDADGRIYVNVAGGGGGGGGGGASQVVTTNSEVVASDVTVLLIAGGNDFDFDDPAYDGQVRAVLNAAAETFTLHGNFLGTPNNDYTEAPGTATMFFVAVDATQLGGSGLTWFNFGV